ncbi:MazE family transcriptional regulator [Xanthomonas gardneri]|nr:MazE family transcriptional regulator [Xanthomonas hortorum pv. gardneri]
MARVGSVSELLAELLTEAEASGAYPLPPEEREWVDAPTVGREWPNDED